MFEVVSDSSRSKLVSKGKSTVLTLPIQKAFPVTTISEQETREGLPNPEWKYWTRPEQTL